MIFRLCSPHIRHIVSERSHRFTVILLDRVLIARAYTRSTAFFPISVSSLSWSSHTHTRAYLGAEIKQLCNMTFRSKINFINSNAFAFVHIHSVCLFSTFTWRQNAFVCRCANEHKRANDKQTDRHTKWIVRCMRALLKMLYLEWEMKIAISRFLNRTKETFNRF